MPNCPPRGAPDLLRRLWVLAEHMTALAAEKLQVQGQLAPREQEHALMRPGHDLAHNAQDVSGHAPSLGMLRWSQTTAAMHHPRKTLAAKEPVLSQSVRMAYKSQTFHVRCTYTIPQLLMPPRPCFASPTSPNAYMQPIAPTPLLLTASDKKRLIEVEPKDEVPLVAEDERLGQGEHTHVQT